MRRMLSIVGCAIGISVCAAGYTPFDAPLPAATMQSVNNAGYMTSGSPYKADVFDVGSYSPTPHAAAGPRKAPPDKDDGTYNPNNPQFSPLGDAVTPLMLMALAFAGYIALRRKNHKSYN